MDITGENITQPSCVVTARSPLNRKKWKDGTTLDGAMNPGSSPNIRQRKKAHYGGGDGSSDNKPEKHLESGDKTDHIIYSDDEGQEERTVAEISASDDEMMCQRSKKENCLKLDESLKSDSKTDKSSMSDSKTDRRAGLNIKTEKSIIFSQKTKESLVVGKNKRQIVGIIAVTVFVTSLLFCGYIYARSSSTKPNLIQVFSQEMEKVQTSFPGQRHELWKRTNIHLKRHLNLTNPLEPVSLILTSGQGAVKTLRCLAQSLATAFSTAQNSSVLGIDGTSKAAQDSNQVKLSVDEELKRAFDGGAQAAVIHHFEEFPPGSTLIFYRYCDHENAAYKKVLLVFTIMLPVTEINSVFSLSEVEEHVQEYLQKKFVSFDRTATFNEMDVDKLSGLWSRISHLILPVSAEQKIEQNGCATSE